MRKQPQNLDRKVNISPAIWKEFNDFCDSYGIGESEEDYGSWWDCWANGFNTAIKIWKLENNINF